MCVGKPFKLRGAGFELTLSSESGDFGTFLTVLVFGPPVLGGILRYLSRYLSCTMLIILPYTT